MLRFGVLTISDRSAQGLRPDTSGPILCEAIETHGWRVSRYIIVPDEYSVITGTLIDLCDSGCIDIILTTGGTGFGPRDITPEATHAVVDRLAPGLSEAILIESLKITPYAMISRAIAGIRKQTLIVNFPGSPKGASEAFQIILPVLPHAIDLLQSKPSAETGHNAPA